jgi:hypothetical protein
MSKATVNFPTRACIFNLTCVDWGVSPRCGRPMVRFYNLTYRWEQLDRNSGRPNGKFDAPTPIAISENWSSCLKTLKEVLGPVTSSFGTLRDVWEPLFLIGSDDHSVRLRRQINTYLLAWHNGRRNRMALDQLHSVMHTQWASLAAIPDPFKDW